MLLVIINIKRKVLFLFRIIMAMAILVILSVQLAGVVNQAGDSYRRWQNRDHPHGNPLKVFIEFDNIFTHEDDRILIKLKKYYRVYKPVE